MISSRLYTLQICISSSCVWQAWEEDSLDTLKLIAHLRDVRDGKADQNLFHDCIAWLWQEHPLTLLANLDEIVKVETVQEQTNCFFAVVWHMLSNTQQT